MKTTGYHNKEPVHFAKYTLIITEILLTWNIVCFAAPAIISIKQSKPNLVTSTLRPHTGKMWGACAFPVKFLAYRRLKFLKFFAFKPKRRQSPKS